MAFFGVNIWNPRNVGSHSTDEHSLDQWVKWKAVYVYKGGNVYRYKINIKASGKIEGVTSETKAHSNSIMIKNVLKNTKYYKR